MKLPRAANNITVRYQEHPHEYDDEAEHIKYYIPEPYWRNTIQRLTGSEILTVNHLAALCALGVEMKDITFNANN